MIRLAARIVVCVFAILVAALLVLEHHRRPNDIISGILSIPLIIGALAGLFVLAFNNRKR